MTNFPILNQPSINRELYCLQKKEKYIRRVSKNKMMFYLNNKY